MQTLCIVIVSACCYDCFSFIVVTFSRRLMNESDVDFIRVLYSTEPTAFHGLFLYLEDNFIVKDKSEMWKCISVVAQKAFEMFLSVKAEKVRFINI